ncbi:MAG: hypothetical protein ABW189_03480 [Rickettsiales bacterium]
MIRFALVTVTFAALFARQNARAGAWPVEDGKGQAMYKTYFYAADRAYDPYYGWKSYAVERYRKIGGEIFAEYGVGDGFTLGTKQRFAYARQDGLRHQTAFDATAHEEQTYFVRKTVFDPASKNVIGAVQLDALLPGFRSGGDDEARTFGPKTYGWTLKGIYGKKLPTKRFRRCAACGDIAIDRFYNAEFGVGERFFDEKFTINASRFRYVAEFTEGFEVHPYFLWSQTFFDFTAGGATGKEEKPLDGDYDLITQRFTLGRHVSESLSLAVGAAFPLGGRDVLKGEEVNLMLWRRF